MSADETHSRFQQLRQRQEENALTAPEQAELERLTQELEAAESVYLRGATERLREQRELVESQNRALAALARRKESLILRLRDVLTEARAERRMIERELATVLAGGQNPETNE